MSTILRVFLTLCILQVGLSDALAINNGNDVSGEAVAAGIVQVQSYSEINAIDTALYSALNDSSLPYYNDLRACHGDGQTWDFFYEENGIGQIITACMQNNLGADFQYCENQAYIQFEYFVDQFQDVECARSVAQFAYEMCRSTGSSDWCTVNGRVGTCTGTVLHADSTEAWVLTAAHCFYRNIYDVFVDGRVDWNQGDALGLPRAKLIVYGTDARVDRVTSAYDSTVFIHPAWSDEPDFVNSPDLALVRVRTEIDELTRGGVFRREIFGGTSQFLERVNVENGASGSVAALSGYAGTTVLRAGLTRAIEPEDDYVDVPASDLVNNQRMEGGDSGGPLTVLSRVRSDHRPVSPATYTREGVVIAVASGPKLFSSFSLDTACPCDFAHTSTHFYTGWLQDTAGGVLTWSSPTFVDTAA